VADARLSTNVSLLNTNQAFTASNRFAGSDAAVYGKKPAATSADDLVLPVSASFIASFTAGNVLKFQITGAAGSGLLPNTGYSTTRPSFSCTIMRLR
jgi:propanediol dehydratase large subunit